MDTGGLGSDFSLEADCDIINPILLSRGIRFSLYSLSVTVALVRHRFPNNGSFNIMNMSLAIAGLLILGASLWQTFHHSLRLSDAVGLILLLEVIRPSWRGAWGRKFWASDLRFSQTRDQSSCLSDPSIFYGLAPWLNYILIDNVFGHPDVFGPRPACNDGVRLSLLGAHVPVALPVTPYAVSILILAIVVAMVATEARHLGLVDEVPLANVLQQLNVRQILMNNDDSRPADRAHVLESYNKSLQNNWVDVTHYRCFVSVLGRFYLIATLEHTLFLNKSLKGAALEHGSQRLQLLVILLVACILLRGLVYGRLIRDEEENDDDDDDDDTRLDLFEWLLQTSIQPGTIQASLADSISFDTRILSTYFNIRGTSSTTGIRSGSSHDVQMLVQSHRQLRKETRRLANEAKKVMPPRNELAFRITSIVLDVALSILAALMAVPVFIASSPLPAHRLVQLATLAGTVKAGLANSTSLLCKASRSNFASIAIFFISVPAITLTVVSILAQKILGDVPASLVNASLIACLPLTLSQSMMLPTFYIFDRRTFLLLFLDALGGYTFVKVAQSSGSIASVSPWQGVFVLLIFGFVTCTIKAIFLAGLASVEQQMVMENYDELETAAMGRLLESPMISSIRFTPYGTEDL